MGVDMQCLLIRKIVSSVSSTVAQDSDGNTTRSGFGESCGSKTYPTHFEESRAIVRPGVEQKRKEYNLNSESMEIYDSESSSIVLYLFDPWFQIPIFEANRR